MCVCVERQGSCRVFPLWAVLIGSLFPNKSLEVLGAPLLGLTPWTHAQHTIRGLKEGYRILKTGLGRTELGTTGLGLALVVMSEGWGLGLGARVMAGG